LHRAGWSVGEISFTSLNGVRHVARAQMGKMSFELKRPHPPKPGSVPVSKPRPWGCCGWLSSFWGPLPWYCSYRSLCTGIVTPERDRGHFDQVAVADQRSLCTCIAVRATLFYCSHRRFMVPTEFGHLGNHLRGIAVPEQFVRRRLEGLALQVLRRSGPRVGQVGEERLYPAEGGKTWRIGSKWRCPIAWDR
jgi:hypothetical protein